jgi:DNA-binding NtrC family response regulator
MAAGCRYTPAVSKGVLIVEDEVHQANALQGLLELDGYAVDTCHDGTSAFKQLQEGYELVLCDLRLPDMDGIELFRRSTEALGDDAPTFVILTAYGTVATAREALKAGVFDYITKPVDPTDLEALVKNIQERRRLRRENRELRGAVARLGLEERFLGKAPAFSDMIALAKNAAASEATILIRGESGTGKELVAELIHTSSPRVRGPFIKVNCGAIPETLLEAELFGHEQGAFTDARRARKGRFELAQNGTIFLDEVGEMSPALQVKLLRVLQERELERLGGQGSVIALDIRVLAATNRDLEAMVRAGTFREDLYYRINVITIDVPPLRERAGDVRLLAEAFCARFSHKNAKDFRGLAPDTVTCLQSHDWPGNARELENVIERAVVMGDGQLLLPSHLSDLGVWGSDTSDDLIDLAVETRISLDDFERELISQALERTSRNVTQAARMLGITRRTLQYRMEKHAIAKDAADSAS